MDRALPSLPTAPAFGAPARAGTVYLVGAGPGDPDLLTLRGLELLSTADIVLHDELVHRALLDLVRPDAEVRWVGKRGGSPREKQATQDEIDHQLVELAQRGHSVVRLKGGDPFLFGRGSEEAEALAGAGIPFEIVPGVCSPIAVAAYAGVSLTHRDLASSVTFVSGTTRRGQSFDFSQLHGLRGTLCVLMGLQRVGDIADALVRDAGYDPQTSAMVVSRGTRAGQRVVHASLAGIAERVREADLATPGLIVIGPVVELRKTLRWFDVLPLFGARVLLPRPEGTGAETAALLRRRGAEPVELPAITIEPPPDPEAVVRAVRDLAGDAYALVVFTSANGVRRFFEVVSAEGFDARVFGRATVAAIGPATARALAALGIRADIVPETFVAEPLADAILARVARGRVLLPRARVAREVLPDMLSSRGLAVDVVPVYETRGAAEATRAALIQRLEQRTIDIALLTSSSTADSLCEMTAPRTAELLEGVRIASIGPVTTRGAVARGLSVWVTAEVSTTEGLVAAIEEKLATP